MSIKIACTRYGMIEGEEKKEYTVFRGIPYAKPPVGERRWRKPEEPESWDGIRKAQQFGACCPQRNPRFEGTMYFKEFHSNENFEPKMSEDCLYLNIWTPAQSAEERLPIILFIHGGAYNGGYSSEIEFDGEAYCRQNVILVTVNYRLGIFGFLAHPVLSAENRQHISGNYGIYDQLAAIKWVSENICNFGGDPKRITLVGQSAGAMSVRTLVSSPLLKGKIAGAVMQSSGGYLKGLCSDLTLEEAEKNGKEILEKCGSISISDLRELSADDVLRIAGKYEDIYCKKGLPDLAFKPCIDNFIMTMGYDKTLAESRHLEIPYIIGSNGNDIGISDEMAKNGERGFLQEGSVNWSLNDEMLGRKADYIYFFDRKLAGDDEGAFHSAELWYIFGTLDRCWRPKIDEDYELSEKMVSYWCNFAKTGDPNGGSLPEWKPCEENDTFVMEFK